MQRRCCWCGTVYRTALLHCHSLVRLLMLLSLPLLALLPLLPLLPPPPSRSSSTLCPWQGRDEASGATAAAAVAVDSAPPHFTHGGCR